MVKNALITVIAVITSALLGSGAFASLPPTVTVLAPVSEGISTPVRIATDTLGNFFLTDPRGGGIMKFSNTGKLLRVFATAKRPQGITVHANGNLIVSQGDSAAILDQNSGAEIKQLGKGRGQFKKANGVAVDAAGFIYVVDSADDCVQVFNATGSPVNIPFATPGKPANSFGSRGNMVGQFILPTGIAYEKLSNQLAVVDTLNGRVQFFSTQGDFRKSIGTFGAGPLFFSAPQGIAFEYSKAATTSLTRLYIVDSFQSLVQVVDPAGRGTFLSYIGSYGTGTGKLTNPSDAVFDQFDPGNSRLVVVNGRGNLTFYGIDKEILSPTPPAGPVLTVNPIPTTTDVSSLAISGTVTAGTTVKVNNGTATVSGTAWNIIVPLMSGLNAISIVATDAAGNVTTQTEMVNLDVASTLLTVNPAVTPTRLAGQMVSGTVDPGATVTVNGNNANVSGNSWSYSALLAEGVNELTITASLAGKDDSITTVSIIRQSTAPAITLSMLADGSTAATPVQNITGLVTSPVLVSLAINGQPVTVANGFFNAAVNLVHGANTIAVGAADAAGNVTAVSRTINFDAAHPVAMSISSPDGIITTAATTILSGSVDKTSSVRVNGNLVVVDANGNWSTTANLAAGLNTFEITATDQAGRTVSAKRTVTADPDRPAVAITSIIQDLATNTPQLTITGTAPASGVTLTGAVNGVNQPVTFANGTFTFSAGFAAEGAYTITVTAVDVAENISTTTRNVLYDVTPPRFTIAPVTAPAPAALSGTIDPGATLTVTDKNGPVGTVAIASNGTWSLDLSSITYDPGTLTITPVDAAGNSSLSGDLDGTGTIDVQDAMKALRRAAGLEPATANDLLRGDVAPLRYHIPAPDGVLDLGDVILILRKAVGLPW